MQQRVGRDWYSTSDPCVSRPCIPDPCCNVDMMSSTICDVINPFVMSSTRLRKRSHLVTVMAAEDKDSATSKKRRRCVLIITRKWRSCNCWRHHGVRKTTIMDIKRNRDMILAFKRENDEHGDDKASKGHESRG